MKNLLVLCSEDDILIQILISVVDINSFEVISSFIFQKLISVNFLYFMISELRIVF